VDWWNASSVIDVDPALHPQGFSSPLGYDLYHTPLWVRLNSVLPRSPLRLASQFGAAAENYAALQFDVLLGWGQSPGSPLPTATFAAWVYEDDGISNDYLVGGIAANTSTVVAFDGTSQCASVTIATVGSYAGLPIARPYDLWFPGSPSPRSVTVDGSAVPQASSDGQPGTWFWLSSGNGTLSPCLRVYGSPVSVTIGTHALVCW
jgi:hypothetical protein